MEEQTAKSERAERSRKALAGANVPPLYRSARFEFGEDAYARVPDDARAGFIANSQKLQVALERPGIYALIGDIGVGKTYLACALVNACCIAGRSGKFMDAGDYIGGVRSTWRSPAECGEERYRTEHVRYSILVVDEFTMRRDSQDENLIMNTLFRKRDEAGRTTLLVGNYGSKEEFESSIDARIADRICQSGGVIFCGGKSLRGRIAPCAKTISSQPQR